MPFRFLWNHPVLLASSAATAGVLLGGYVAVHLFAAPAELASKPTPPKTPAPALASAGPPETTGSGSSEHGDKDADHCDRQTWPYLSRDCMERMQNKKRVSRVISTDHIEKPVVARADTASPPPSGAAVGSQAKGSPPVQAAPPASSNVQPTNPVDTTAIASQPESHVQTQAKAKDTHKAEAKRKSKAEKRKLAKRKVREKEPTEDRDVVLATGDSDDRIERRRDRGESSDSDGWADRSNEDSARGTERRRSRDDSDDRAERRRDREQYGERRRVRAARSGDRWGAEREYDVPASDGEGRRRVIVIQRGSGPSGGGLFGGFGGLFGDD